MGDSASLQDLNDEMAAVDKADLPQDGSTSSIATSPEADPEAGPQETPQTQKRKGGRKPVGHCFNDRVLDEANAWLRSMLPLKNGSSAIDRPKPPSASVEPSTSSSWRLRSSVMRRLYNRYNRVSAAQRTSVLC